ncbi:MAG: hypothetical protein CSA94_01730, partial [Bacteroidetes bacterium]
LVGSSLLAQTEHNKWNVGLHANFTGYKGDLGNGFFSTRDMSLGASLSASRYISPYFDVTGKIGWSTVKFRDTDGVYAYSGSYAKSAGIKYGDWRFKGDLLSAAANLKLKSNNGWLLKEEAGIAPYLIGGLGFTYFDGTSTKNMITDNSDSNFTLYYGAGVNFRLSERLNLVLEAGIYNPMTDVYDGIDEKTVSYADVDDSNDHFLQYSVGFTFSLGKIQDADGDGIADRKDKCPETPEGVAVDDYGCAIDSDCDGFPDYLDKCPEVPGTIQGCPDTDGDGVADKDDACPKVKGPKANNGCPWKDTDGDGITDNLDKCPKVKGPKANNGCPWEDTDGDGITDNLDKCPKVKGPKHNDGCPEILSKEAEAKIYSYSREIYFDTGKFSFKPGVTNQLDKIAEIMNKFNKANFSIEGHTDSVGSKTLNKKLSEKRAKAVLDYLVRKGINSNRLTSYGFGEEYPIHSNKTKEGRALNRRVEIKNRVQ